jgi:hypothetical protein
MAFLGLVGFGDEVRAGVRESVEKLRRAGVQVKMVTGESPRTGAAVARAVGILNHGGGTAEEDTRGRSRSRSRDHSSSTAADPLLAATSLANGGHDALIPGVCVGRLGTVIHGRHHRSSHSHSRSRGHSSKSSPAHSRDVSSASASSFTATAATDDGSPAKHSGDSSIPKSSSSSSLLHAASGGGKNAASASPFLYDLSASVYCRMTPGDKLGLVKAHQAVGQRVLVTGGGLHDSPALTCAEAGLAMGSSGSGASTDLARESAGVVLTRDDFRSVVSAIAESRRALSNLAVSVRFYLSGKVALLLLFLTSLVLGLDMPLSPLHVILVATLADTGASLAFANAPAEPDLMVQGKGNAAKNRWGSNTFMAGLRFAFASVGLGTLLMLMAIGGVLFGAHQLVLVENHESSSGHHHHSAADISVLLDLEGETSAFEAAKNAGTSAATPNMHASSTFFPEGLLSPFHRDEHLALTQSLVLLGWMVASALLALFVRGSDGAGGCGRSSWFACCDRRSVRVLRARQRQLREQDELLARARRSASGEDDDEYAGGSSVGSLSPRSALSVAMHAGRTQGYDSLSQAEEGGLGAHRAFLAAPSSSSKQLRTKEGRKEASERKSSSSALLLDDSSTLSDGDDSDASSSSAAGGGASAAAPEQLEGLHKPRTRASSMNKHASTTRSSAAAASSPVLPDASLFALVFPLFAHPALLLWCFATLLVGVLCTTTLAASVPALHEALHLAPVDVYVQLPNLFGKDGPAVAAWWIAVAPPLVVFFIAELVKFVCSWCLRTADNECTTK